MTEGKSGDNGKECFIICILKWLNINKDFVIIAERIILYQGFVQDEYIGNTFENSRGVW